MKLQQVQALLEACANDAEIEAPYAELYERAEDLKQQIANLSPNQLEHACLQGQRGVLLLETDLLAEAEVCITASLPILEAAGQLLQAPPLQQGQQQQHQSACQDCSSECMQPRHWVQLQAMYNGLGALWSQRGDFPAALTWLDKAQQLASQAPCDVGARNSLQSAASALSPGLTTTMFYLAQVHGHAGNKELSASYCGATLQRQLEAGDFDRSEWVQNCLQLAAYYCSCNAFAVARRCIKAAELVATGQPEQQQRAARHDQTTEARVVQQASPVIDEDIAANLHLAAAKLCKQRLLCSYRQHVALPECSSGGALAPPSFPSLASQLPADSDVGPASAALVHTFDGARGLFNEGMQHYNAALAFYRLDGWVTDHVNLLLEISNMLMLLAAFEPDAARRAAMHKLRALRLQPACGNSLNMEHYLGLVRSVELECANAWRDCLEARSAVADAASATGNGTPQKFLGCKAMLTTAQSAATHYRTFLASYDVTSGRVPDDEENTFLAACFSLGRVLHRCASEAVDNHPPGKQLAILIGAHEHLLWCCKYVGQHNISQYKQEAALASELATLVAEKIELQRRLQAAGKLNN